MPNQKVLVHTTATSLANIANLKLTINNQAIALDEQGRGEFIPNAPGRYIVEATATATDISGRKSSTEALIEINSTTKTSKYERTETDLTVNFAGTNLDLVRVYDSLNQSTAGTFGFGWRLANTDTKIQTNVPLTGREQLGVYHPLEIGSRLYLTLPNGQRVGFTFQPQKQEIPGLVYYTPAWVADAGVNYSLQSVDALLTLASDRLYELKTGQPYNPVSQVFTGYKYTLTAPDGTVYHLDAAGEVKEQITPTGTKFTCSDSGITSSTGEVISWVHDAQGRLTEITAPDGRKVVYTYDSQGNLVAARNLALGQSSRYGYDEQHRLILASGLPGEAGAAVDYSNQQPQILPVIADLGSAYQFISAPTTGNLAVGASQRYTFSVRNSEVISTDTKQVLIGVEVQAKAGSSLQPGLPVIRGLIPLATQIKGDRAFALFAINREGLNLLEVSGVNSSTSGEYSLQIFVAGDVNRDRQVDGVDSQQVISALGTKLGDAGYNASLDINLDGAINATDVQILGSNFGFIANQAPVVKPTTILTHEDLEVTVPLVNLATDLEGDSVFYRLINPVNGTVQISPNGQLAIFKPNIGYTGTASFDLLADDGFNTSTTVKLTVNVSNAPLINLDFLERNPRLAKGKYTQLSFVGNFADQQNTLICT